MVFKVLIRKILRYNKKCDVALLEKAYNLSKIALINDKRISGRDRLKHNLEVASLLADIRADDITIASGLLHNILDAGVTYITIKKDFGDDIALILKATMKGGIVSTDRYSNASAFRRMLMASVRDPRVLLIKIANKISSLRDLSAIDDVERKRDIAREALNIYAPIAHKLGLASFKEELEDLSFEVLEPGICNEIVTKLKESKHERSITLHKAKRMLMLELSKEGIVAEVQGRTKHIYSIYKKIMNRDYTLEAMRDLVGIRVITHSLEDCYNVLRVIHQKWRPMPNTFKDYISMPKPNGYQSLHEVVYGPDNKVVEFQIRTKDMHEYAEEGIAAHSKYKGITDNKSFDRKLYWLKEALNNLSKEKVVDTRTIHLFEEKIYVLTPRRDVIELPRGATVLDFAYAVHTSLGNFAVGAYINDKYVTLRTQVNNGDCVRIMTQKNHKPSMEWLNFVITSRAKDKIRDILRKSGKVVSGSNVSSDETSISFLVHREKKKNLDIVSHKRCNPLPLDNIVLEIDTNRNLLLLHKSDCARALNAKNWIECSWKKFNDKRFVFEVECKDRVGMFSEILNIFSIQGINLDNARAEAKGDCATCFIKTKIKDLNELNRVVCSLRHINDVRAIVLKEII